MTLLPDVPPSRVMRLRRWWCGLRGHQWPRPLFRLIDSRIVWGAYCVRCGQAQVVELGTPQKRMGWL